jgi:hypothetical protein
MPPSLLPLVLPSSSSSPIYPSAAPTATTASPPTSLPHLRGLDLPSFRLHSFARIIHLLFAAIGSLLPWVECAEGGTDQHSLVAQHGARTGVGHAQAAFIGCLVTL